MKTILSVLLAISALGATACGSSDPCEKLTKDVCGDDKECAAWVEADLLEGSKNKETCSFLTEDSDYKSWIKLAKESYEDDKKK